MIKILKMIDVLLFIGLVFSIILTDGNKIDLVLCTLITIDSLVIYRQESVNRKN